MKIAVLDCFVGVEAVQRYQYYYTPAVGFAGC